MTISNIPDFKVTLDGTDLTDKVRPRLVSLTLSEKRGDEADQLDLVLDDTDGKLAIPKEGARLSVQLGWRQGSDVTPGLIDKGAFTVDEVEHSGPPDRITIRARSADFTSDLRLRREKSWHDTTIGAVVSEIAGRNGLKARCAAALAGKTLKSLVQSRESDMALLRRLGREYDAVATIKGGALLFLPIGSGATATGKPLPVLAIQRRNGDGHSFRREKRDEVAGVSASYHDRRDAKRKKVTAGNEAGAKHLSRVYSSEETAKAAAQAAKRRAARQPVTLSMTLSLGRADVYPEQKATVSGFKPEIDAVQWLLGEVSHNVSKSGYVTELKFESAP